MDLYFLGIRCKVYINDSPVNITNNVQKNAKACSQISLFMPFGLPMVLCG